MDRLDELAGLKDGWLDGAGAAVTPAAVQAMRSVLAQPGLPTHALFPTEEGGVLCEFDHAGWDGD